jgi:hypothetical protein
MYFPGNFKERGIPKEDPVSDPTAKAGGFRTGDIVRAIVLTGKKAGTYTGKVAVRATGNFNITTETGTVQGISHIHCRTIHKGDGYVYI